MIKINEIPIQEFNNEDIENDFQIEFLRRFRKNIKLYIKKSLYIFKGRKPEPIGTVSGNYKKTVNGWVRIQNENQSSRAKQREEANKARKEPKKELIEKYKDRPEFIQLMNMPQSAWKEVKTTVKTEKGKEKTKTSLILTDNKFVDHFVKQNAGLFIKRANNIGVGIGLKGDDLIDFKISAQQLLQNALNSYGKDHDPKNPKDIYHHLNQQMLPLQYMATKLKHKEFTPPQNIVKHASKYEKLFKEHKGDLGLIHENLNLKIKDVHPDLSDHKQGNDKLPFEDFHVKEQSKQVIDRKNKEIEHANKTHEKFKNEIDNGYKNKDSIVTGLNKQKENLLSLLQSEKDKIIAPLQESINKKKNLFKSGAIPEIIKKQIAEMQKVIDNPVNDKTKEINSILSDLDKQIEKSDWTADKYKESIDFLNKKKDEHLNKINDKYKFINKRKGGASVYQELDSYLGKKRIRLDDLKTDQTQSNDKADSIVVSNEYAQKINKEVKKLENTLGSVLNPRESEIMKMYLGIHEKNDKKAENTMWGHGVTNVEKLIDMIPNDLYGRKKDPQTSYYLNRVESKTFFKNPNYEKELKDYNAKKAKNKGNIMKWVKDNPAPSKVYHKDSKEGQALYKQEREAIHAKTVKESKQKQSDLSKARKRQLLTADIKSAKAKIFQNLNLFKDNGIFKQAEDILKKSIKV
jgi:hypothetical protein